MKRYINFIVIGSLLFSLAPQLAAASGCYVDPVHQYTGRGTVKSAVFLRDQACVTGSSVLLTLSSGAAVDVIGFTDGWYRVEWNGARGWVGQQFIETSASQTGVSWQSYEAYMSEFPSRNRTTTPTPPTTSTETVYTGTILARNLIKLACPSGATVDHPCKAVYYIGVDGRRHAFPNSRVYFTWYTDFNSVKAVAADRLSQYSLGANVTYRPGARMVKFTTDPKVYVVARGGSLRWVTTENLASAYYGTAWNTKIDDISDVFYTNYSFSADVSSVADYSPTTELAAAVTID